MTNNGCFAYALAMSRYYVQELEINEKILMPNTTLLTLVVLLMHPE
jgi:hypothetical protein